MIFAGVDPGASGALAMIDDSLNVLAIEDSLGDTESAAALFRDLYLKHDPTFVYLESVSAMPKQRSLTTARRLFPDANIHFKKHHGRTDALLLARLPGTGEIV